MSALGMAVPTDLQTIVRGLAPPGPCSQGITLETVLGAEGLGLDSVAIVQLLVACEQRWAVPFPAELLQCGPLTIGRLVEHLDRRRAA